MKTLTIVALAAVLVTPLQAQGRVTEPEPDLSLRPFALIGGQRASASETFNAIFGSSFEPFWGGGLELALGNGFYVDAAASRFKKTGQRAFLVDGQAYRVGIPLTATITPIEVTAGYRFLDRSPKLVPYLGAGVGSYAYTEISSGDPDFNARHVGYLVVGGLEFRLSRWLRLSGDAQYTRVPGILGAAGVSKDAGESSLGGVAGRLKLMVGR